MRLSSVVVVTAVASVVHDHSSGGGGHVSDLGQANRSYPVFSFPAPCDHSQRAFRSRDIQREKLSPNARVMRRNSLNVPCVCFSIYCAPTASIENISQLPGDTHYQITHEIMRVCM